MAEIHIQLLNMDTKIPEQLIKNDDTYTIFYMLDYHRKPVKILFKILHINYKW